MADLISRQAAIDELNKGAWGVEWDKTLAKTMIESLSSAQPEVKEIGYAECANAMLKMWIDNVLTDGEYNRIMNRLNDYHNAGNTGRK